MRVISGQFKGRRLIVPKSIRPTENKVKKALFDIMRNVIGDCRFLDLYAGAGTIGIEAISQGAGSVYFVERDLASCQIIRNNLNQLSIGQELYQLITEDVFNAISLFRKQGQKFDLIFMDPPYYQDIAKKTLQLLGSYDILAGNGFIIVEHHRKDVFLERFGELKLWRTRTYSTTLLSFYCKATSLYFE